MWRGVRVGRPLLALGLTLTAIGAILLFDPGRTATAHHLCSATGSPFGPFNVETYEHGDYRNAYTQALELAGYNQLFPGIPSFALPRLETGDRAAGSAQTVDPYIPPVILKAIAWLESGWSQASIDPLVQYGEVGPTLISHDCGYGIMQVTTGMQNVSGVPNLDQAMIAGHYAFNIARGARILADKWNQATEFRPIVGDRNPHVIEDWYFALWGYNGFALQNHPLADDNAWPRPPYDCRAGTDKSIYPYQELVFGCIMNPPVRGGVPLWQAQPVSIPDWSNPAFGGPLSPDNWGACSSGNCGAMDIPRPEGAHTDPTVPPYDRSAVLGLPDIKLSKEQVLFAPDIAGASASTNLQISNPGSGVLAFRVTSGAPWLKVSRNQGVALGTDLGGRALTLNITAETAGLAAGFYSAIVRVESLYGHGSPRLMTVNLAYNPNTSYPEGSLLKGSGDEVYVLAGGVRRHVPDLQTFFARGLTWESVVSVSDAALASYPIGSPLPSILRDGTLIQGTGPEIYVLLAGQRRHVPSPDIFNACGFGWDAVQRVSGLTVAVTPDGGQLLGSCPRLSPPDGALIKGSDTYVYEMRGGLKRHIPNPFTLLSSGRRFAEIDVYPDSTVNAIPVGHPLLDAAANGNLYKSAGPEVYVTEGGVRRHVTSPEAMAACGYDWAAVKQVASDVLGQLPVGPSLAGPPCARFAPGGGVLLKGSGPAVYVSEGGNKRNVRDVAAFAACGYLWANLNVVADGMLATLPEAAPVTAPPCP